jgi:hypothetical protein
MDLYTFHMNYAKLNLAANPAWAEILKVIYYVIHIHME